MMKVLLTPLIFNDNADSGYYLSKNISTLLTTTNHTVAISAPTNNKFHHASFYSSPRPSSTFKSKTKEKTYTDHLFNKGALDIGFLRHDLNSILKSINDFNPDIIVTHDRLSALIAAKMTNKLCYAIVEPSIFAQKNIPSNILSGLNEILSSKGFEQVFSLNDFYKYANQMFIFGPIETSPCISDYPISRIGLSSLYTQETQERNDLFIHLGNTNIRKGKLKKIVLEAFDGAPYRVNAFIGKDYEYTKNNIHFISSKTNFLDTAKACIHDGNSYIFNTCLSLGIPQLIIANNDFVRLSLGTKAQRNGFGLCLFEDEFKMENLYEAYYRLINTSYFFENAEILKASTLSEGDLSEILQYF